MKGSLPVRRGLIWTVAALAAVVVAGAALVATVQSQYGRGLLIRYFASRLGRPIEVAGAFEAHLFSLKPRVTANRVVIRNPPWMPAGVTAQIGTLSMVLELPGFERPSGIVGLEMQAATFHLARDARGRANWQLTDPAKDSAESHLPILRSLSLVNAHVVLEDALRHLHFDGTVSAVTPSDVRAATPLQINGAGQLNGRAAAFEISGAPLAAASHKAPYHFTFAEESSGSRLVGHGVLPRPFDFDSLDATFDAVGADLKDLYFLVGVSLIDTGAYHLSGRLSRRGTQTQLSDLVATFGQSDVHGTVSIDSSPGKSMFNLDFNSQVLRTSDLGARAAGRSSEPKSPLLLSPASLSPDLVRNHDATVKFHAQRVDVGSLPLTELSATATITHGVLTVAPLLAEVLGGKVDARLRLDTDKSVPAADVDLTITDLELGQIHRREAGPALVEGQARARVTITGSGTSAHQIAASANGTVRVWVSQGAIRESAAELTGVDLRGLGLLLTKDTQQIPVRCARANFKAHDGTLIVESLVVDTEPILITGAGQIELDTEALNLNVRGHPKKLRLFRLRTPVRVRGTLAHPTFDIHGGNSKLVIVDPGRAKDADCAALLGEE